jgi:hypothetical protein
MDASVAPPRKNRQPGDQRLLCIAEQLVTPVDQRVQRLLPR